MRRVGSMRLGVAVVALVLGACGGVTLPDTSATPTEAGAAPTATPTDDPSSLPDEVVTKEAAETPTTPAETPTPNSTPSGTAEPEPTAEPESTVTVVEYRVEIATTGVDTAAFADDVDRILTDPRGWQQAGFAFIQGGDGAPYTIVIGEGDEVDRRCLPYDTYARFSCQNGPVVAINADRWRTATETWTSSLADYRTMLINHEVGHLIHLHHPRPQCPAEGFPMPVMGQQSTELGACTANPWPLPWEIELAARKAEPLAPPADHDVSDHRPSPPPQRHG